MLKTKACNSHVINASTMSRTARLISLSVNQFQHSHSVKSTFLIEQCFFFHPHFAFVVPQ